MGNPNDDSQLVDNINRYLTLANNNESNKLIDSPIILGYGLTADNEFSPRLNSSTNPQTIPLGVSGISFHYCLRV